MDTTVTLKEKIKILGITVDNHLTMDSQVSEICRSAYYHIHALWHVRPVITDEVAKTIACSFVTSRLDYANSVLYGISAKNIHRLQQVQHALAFSVLQRPISATLPIYCHLHWLPVQYRIQFKLTLLAFNARNNNAPLYLSCLLHNYVTGHSLRSSQSNLLCVPAYKLNFGTRSFALPRFSLLWMDIFQMNLG